MILFGDGPLYLSHLPMFHAPHDVQLVLEVRVVDPAPELPRSFLDGLYTFEPEPFSLDAVRTGARTRFTGAAFRGNFEQGGVPIGGEVSLEVVRVVYDEELDAARPTAATPEYLALGRLDEAVLVHLLGGAPGFDHLVVARFDAGGPAAAELARGVRVQLAGAGNTPEGRLAPGAAAAAALTVTRELSCLVGPDFTEPCPP